MVAVDPNFARSFGRAVVLAAQAAESANVRAIRIKLLEAEQVRRLWWRSFVAMPVWETTYLTLRITYQCVRYGLGD